MRRPKTTRKKQVKALIKGNGLRKDAPRQKKWWLDVETVKGNEVNLATFIMSRGTTPDNFRCDETQTNFLKLLFKTKISLYAKTSTKINKH